MKAEMRRGSGGGPASGLRKEFAMNIRGLLGGVFTACVAGSMASAAVIPGPVLTSPGAGWTTTGLEFQALDNSTLTGFTYQNQGQADTIVLTDTAGTILQSISTPAGTPTDAVSVNWALTSGKSYWLLQTIASNELFSGYNLPLPSDADIAVIFSGTFDYGIPAAVSNSQNWGSNELWAGFNNLTTVSGTVPEPSTWAFLTVGLFGLGAALRRRRNFAVA